MSLTTQRSRPAIVVKPVTFAPRKRNGIAAGTTPIAFRAPMVLLPLSLGIIAMVWWWLAIPVTLAHAPIDATARMDCLSYAPFRGTQTPMTPGIVISPEDIAEDLAEIAKISKCVRTYSVDNGLDKVPELAAQAGLKVLLGVWIGGDYAKNELLIEIATSLARSYPGVITGIVVGNELLLRKEISASALREIILSVKARVNVPVTYADVWETWLRNQELSSAVDFVTVHMLPYWEDAPPRAEDAAAHVDAIRRQLTIAFPAKEILIGEAGWPSRGRMRNGALPSRINQARFNFELLNRAKQGHYPVTLFEAYDGRWKRQWEGTVGGHWGLFDGMDRKLKYPFGVAVGNYPFWKLQLGAGLALGISVFGAALWTARRQPSRPRLMSWVAVAVSATVAGVLLGISAERMLLESYGIGDWLVRSMLMAAGIATPLLCSNALMSGRALPTFLELVGPSERRTSSVPTMLLGFTLIATTLIAVQTALGLVFDPRWRDFLFAELTLAVAPLALLQPINRAKSGKRPIAETMFAALLAVAALYCSFNEGFENWQALWTSSAYLLLGATLWQARCHGRSGIDRAGRLCLSADQRIHRAARSSFGDC